MPAQLKFHFCQRLESRVPENIKKPLLLKVQKILLNTNLLRPEKVTVIIGGISISVVVELNCAITVYQERPRFHQMHANRSSHKRNRRRGGKSPKKKKY